MSASAGAADRRRELGMFLRARRERLAPGDVGLPGSPRRRTPGLRREELASLARISATWYTFLEQGRDVRPSPAVLTAIAGALRLDDAARSHLEALAADGPAPAERPETVSPEVAAVPAMLDPDPAYVTGARYDLLAWNDAAAALFRGADEGDPANLARWVFADERARQVLVDWEEVAQRLLGRIRANAGRHPSSPAFARLERELRDASPEADAWWPRYDIASGHPGTKRVRDADGRERLLAYASFQVADRPEQVLTIYRPA